MYSRIGPFASARVLKRRWWTISVFSEPKTLSIGASKPACRSRAFWSERGRGLLCKEMVEDLVGDAAFRASADFAGRLSLGGAALDVGEGRRVAAHARDRDAAERRVRPPVSTPVEAVAGPLAAGRRTGRTPQSSAKAASHRMRSGLSPRTTSISSIVSVETPGASIGAGARLRTSPSRAASCCLMSSSRASRRRASTPSRRPRRASSSMPGRPTDAGGSRRSRTGGAEGPASRRSTAGGFCAS